MSRPAAGGPPGPLPDRSVSGAPSVSQPDLGGGPGEPGPVGLDPIQLVIGRVPHDVDGALHLRRAVRHGVGGRHGDPAFRREVGPHRRPGTRGQAHHDVPVARDRRTPAPRDRRAPLRVSGRRHHSSAATKKLPHLFCHPSVHAAHDSDRAVPRLGPQGPATVAIPWSAMAGGCQPGGRAAATRGKR